MKKLSDNHRIIINAGSNACVMLAKVAITFVVAPILVHGLGDSRYGVWMLVGSIAAYLFLAEFGVKSAVIRFVAQYDGLHDPTGINRVVNTSMVLMLGAGSIVFAGSLLVAAFWQHPMSVPQELVGEAKRFLVLQGILVATLLPASIPSSLLAGLGRFPARNLVSFLSLILRNSLLVAVVWSGGGLIAIGYALLVSCLFDFIWSYLAARHCFPQLTFSLRYVDRATVRALWSFSAHIFTGDIAFLVIGQSAPLIIGATLASSDSITHFSIGSALRDYSLTILGAIVIVLMPAVSKWESTNDRSSIRTALVHATRYALYFAAPIEVGLFVLGPSFLALWMGSGYAAAGSNTLMILSFPLVLAAASQVAVRFLQGLGLVRPLAMINVLQAALTIGLSIFFARPLGIDGVALGVSLALGICAPAIIVLACRSTGLKLTTLVREAGIRPLLASAGAACVWVAGNQLIHVDGWAALVAVATTGAAVYGVLVILLEQDVRHAIGAAGRQVTLLYREAKRRAAVRLDAPWTKAE